MGELEGLVAKLLVTAHVLGGYAIPAVAPSVTMVPDEELAAAACTGGCQTSGRLNGLFLPGRGILLSERLAPLRNVRARAVLLHEMVHYLQHLTGSFAGQRPCERYLLREREAYGVENRYLARFQEPPDHGWTFLAQNGGLISCRDGQR